MSGYTTRVRHLRPTLRGTVNGLVTPGACTPRKAEYVYSWRSRSSDQDLTDLETRSNFGVRNPTSTGNVFDLVADRKRWADELNQTFGGVKDPTNQSQCTVYSKTDTGHYFRSLKWEALNVGRYIQRNYSTGAYSFDCPFFASTSAFVPMGWPDESSVFPSTATLPSGHSQVPILEKNSRMNQTFASMAPQAPGAQLGETVVSILRGDFPSLLTNLKAWTRPGRIDWTATPNTLGGGYLNSVFGWQPLIRDFQNAISVLMTLDHLIYGEAFRRHRVIPWSSQFSRTTMTSFAAASPYRMDGKGSTLISAGWREDAKPELVTTSHLDVRLSAQLAPIARPGLGANKYVDQAGDILQDLGLWYPALGWDLLPYSWLVDWFLHLGAAFTNASYYGSATGMTSVDYAWGTTCLRVNSQVNFPVRTYRSGAFEYQFLGSPLSTSVAKIRERATPFGFGVDLSALTSGQIAILVALGLAKVR